MGRIKLLIMLFVKGLLPRRFICFFGQPGVTGTMLKPVGPVSIYCD